METKELIPDYKMYCNMFNGENNESLNIKIPYVTTYSSVGYLLSNLIKGIGILAQYSIENENNEVVSIISDLADIANGLDVQEELSFVDRIIQFSNNEELTKDEKTKVLENKIEMLLGSNRYLLNELHTLKNTKNESNI